MLEAEPVSTNDLVECYLARATDLPTELVRPACLLGRLDARGPVSSPDLSHQAGRCADALGAPLHVPEKFRCSPSHVWFGSSGLLGISCLNREPDHSDSSCVLSEIPDLSAGEGFWPPCE